MFLTGSTVGQPRPQQGFAPSLAVRHRRVCQQSKRQTSPPKRKPECSHDSLKSWPRQEESVSFSRKPSGISNDSDVTELFPDDDSVGAWTTASRKKAREKGGLPRAVRRHLATHSVDPGLFTPVSPVLEPVVTPPGPPLDRAASGGLWLGQHDEINPGELLGPFRSRSQTASRNMATLRFTPLVCFEDLVAADVQARLTGTTPIRPGTSSSRPGTVKWSSEMLSDLQGRRVRASTSLGFTPTGPVVEMHRSTPPWFVDPARFVNDSCPEEVVPEKIPGLRGTVTHVSSRSPSPPRLPPPLKQPLQADARQIRGLLGLSFARARPTKRGSFRGSSSRGSVSADLRALPARPSSQMEDRPKQFTLDERP
eukprot:CAMPEP_0114569368 /NCGR_PEP_ID=MMETSP0114-20121206/16590_1 /TAXON_ID=31324 /ORGANISM="Goniomonas sp, Strain m" /LENGTH=366 /DNA_ID=CAMNT_0001756245 /DNA_START=89 /DNA_END=1185 /DNA_ORIENTATION=-